MIRLAGYLGAKSDFGGIPQMEPSSVGGAAWWGVRDKPRASAFRNCGAKAMLLDPLEGAPGRGDRVMRWRFWTKRESERRESLPFTDAVVAALAAQAAGQSVGDPGAIAALEAATALYARAFSAARSSLPRCRRSQPSTMALIARNLIRRGEDVAPVARCPGRASPTGNRIVGRARRAGRKSAWWYRCDRFGPVRQPDGASPRCAAVLHCRLCRPTPPGPGMESRRSGGRGLPGRWPRTWKPGLAKRRAGAVGLPAADCR